MSVNPQVVVPQPPKQTKLLGATVKGVGVITTVGVQNIWRWALVERPDGTEAHVFVSDLTKDMLEFLAEPQAYRAVTRRIGYGLIEECWELVSVPFSDLTHVSREEAAA